MKVLVKVPFGDHKAGDIIELFDNRTLLDLLNTRRVEKQADDAKLIKAPTSTPIKLRRAVPVPTVSAPKADKPVDPQQPTDKTQRKSKKEKSQP